MTRPVETLSAPEVLAFAVNVERAEMEDGHAGWLGEKLKCLGSRKDTA